MNHKLFMKALGIIAVLCFCLLASVVRGQVSEEIRLGSDPALSPDGLLLAFTWRRVSGLFQVKGALHGS